MKNKKILLAFIIILIIGLVVGVFIFYRERDKSIALTKDSVIIEYGESYNPGLEELIDLTKFNFIDQEKIRMESNIKNEDDKEYPAVGTYSVDVYYKNITLSQNVEVKDTVSPELSIQDSIEVENGIDINTFDLSTYIKISDLSEVNDYNVDLSNVNTNIAGEYIAKISVEDIYENITEKEFKIVIPEKQEPIVETKDESNNNKTTINNNTKTSTNNSSSNKSNSKANNANNKTTTGTSTNNNANSSNSNNSNNQPATTTKSNWCIDGGPNHIAGTDANEHGYYKSWDAAWEACKNYMKSINMGSGNYKVDQCPCGLYYFWVRAD